MHNNADRAKSFIEKRNFPGEFPDRGSCESDAQIGTRVASALAAMSIRIRSSLAPRHLAGLSDVTSRRAALHGPLTGAVAPYRSAVPVTAQPPHTPGTCAAPQSRH